MIVRVPMYAYGCVAVVKGSVIFRISRDRRFWLEMLPALVDFWTHMRQNIPPEEKHINSETIKT
jgi:hypothetical protein